MEEGTARSQKSSMTQMTKRSRARGPSLERSKRRNIDCPMHRGCWCVAGSVETDKGLDLAAAAQVRNAVVAHAASIAVSVAGIAVSFAGIAAGLRRKSSFGGENCAEIRGE